MFSGIKKRWAEARADVAAREVQDILDRFERYDRSYRYLVTSAFAHVRSSIEEEAGDSAAWSEGTRQKAVKKLSLMARHAFSGRNPGFDGEWERISSHGAALLSLYYEAQGLPGPRAVWIIQAVEAWRSANDI